MVDQKMLLIPDETVRGQPVLLSKAISAVRLERKENGVGAKLGSLSQLRPGTTLTVCGEGFDERTVKVRANGEYYFVFSQDIPSLTNLKKLASGSGQCRIRSG